MTDLLDMAGGDPDRAELLRQALQRLADGPDGLLKEMARSVLDGEVPLRSAVFSDVYGAELGRSLIRFWDSKAGQEMVAEALEHEDNDQPDSAT